MWFLVLLSSCTLSPFAQGGSSEISDLRDAAMFGKTPVIQGEAIQALASQSDPSADQALADIQSFGNATDLVRTWAGAAQIQRAKTLSQIADLAPLAQTHPALKRPLRLKVANLPGSAGTTELLTLAITVPALQSALTPLVTESGVESVAHAMLTHENIQARRLAAGLIGGMASGDDTVPSRVAAAYAYIPGAQAVPWQGGALYVPGLAWNRDEARTIMGSLIEWHLYCDRKGLTQEQQQIYNNVRSVGLWRQAGVRDFPNNNTVQLLTQWRQVVGARELAQILERQGVRYEPTYAAVLDR